jgi:hypothetical protein
MLLFNASKLTNGPSSRAFWIILQDCTGVTLTEGPDLRTGVEKKRYFYPELPMPGTQ